MTTDDVMRGFDLYQQAALKTVAFPAGGEIWYPALGLGEAGEVQNKVKKIFRDDDGVLTDQRKKAIMKEMGGNLWYLATLAHGLRTTLGQIALDNIEELKGRVIRGTLKGDGDDR
jgi:NTP pyrophosphatase (non-canonical NTP hydrolase)